MIGPRTLVVIVAWLLVVVDIPRYLTYDLHTLHFQGNQMWNFLIPCTPPPLQRYDFLLASHKRELDIPLC